MGTDNLRYVSHEQLKSSFIITFTFVNIRHPKNLLTRTKVSFDGNVLVEYDFVVALLDKLVKSPFRLHDDPYMVGVSTMEWKFTESVRPESRAVSHPSCNRLLKN